MATLKKYDLTGASTGEVLLDDQLLDVNANSQMLKDYLIALRANQRQWSANTQTRAEVNHSTRKPYAQKGTGNARQGFLGSPQFRGGGRVHAPRPKYDQHVRINRKERRLAIRHLLSEHIKDTNVHVLQYSALSTPHTKSVADFLKALNISGKRVLFLAEKGHGDYGTLLKSVSNIPKVEFNYLSQVNGYDLALCNQLILLEGAVNELKETLGGNK